MVISKRKTNQSWLYDMRLTTSEVEAILTALEFSVSVYDEHKKGKPWPKIFKYIIRLNNQLQRDVSALNNGQNMV